MHCAPVHSVSIVVTTSYDMSGWFASSGNSVGVAISEPRVEVRSASTLGIYIIRCSYSVRVAISRRRYTQSDTIHLSIPAHHPATSNAYG